MTCPYCGAAAELVDSKKVYKRSYGLIWCCVNYPACDAYVGVHRGTDVPLGRMADADLRAWKGRAHALFDPIWRSGRMKRGQAYRWLARELGLIRDECHIGMFDVDRCKQVVELMELSK